MKKIINTGLLSMFLLASQLSHAGEKTVIFTCEDQSKIVQYQHSVDIDSEVDYVTLRQGRKKTELYITHKENDPANLPANVGAEFFGLSENQDVLTIFSMYDNDGDDDDDSKFNALLTIYEDITSEEPTSVHDLKCQITIPSDS